MKIGIMGYGVVGGTTGKVLGLVHHILPYDRYKAPYNTEKHLRKLAREAEVVFICVPTPMFKNSGRIDLSAIYHSLETLKQTLVQVKRRDKDIIVVIRSTAVSGTTDKLQEKYPMFHFVVNPEFLTEKNSLEDMLHTKRVVIGVYHTENFSGQMAEDRVRGIYQALFPNAQYFVVGIKMAEFFKYASNAMLAMQVALSNELAQIAKVLGLDYGQVVEFLLTDPRIGRNIKVPGPDGKYGFGGKCFPKDLRALISLSRRKGYRPRLFEAGWDLNLRVRPEQDRDWTKIDGAVSEEPAEPKKKSPRHKFKIVKRRTK